jgi:asparagine synthase (glutamine-hydrolysing)
MCGICGKLNFDPSAKVSRGLLESMADTIAHRGPDDEGYYASGPVGFGFRRLSIIDLSSGHQPLSNEDETVWVVFNGEIYNYLELRQELQQKGHRFKTKTDTEVIVHLYEEFGAGCVEKLRGMFAFAVWDERGKTLLLARDRVGIKPLYYSVRKNALIFASEIKAILADPEVEAEIRPEMIDEFLTFYYMPGSDTLFRGIKKLDAGCLMIVKDGAVKIQKYWDLDFTTRHRPLKDAMAELESLLEESVRMHMISDVPVGFLLSGGVDSTAVLGLAAGKTSHALSSYTLGFDAKGITDERPYARLAARTYGSEHHELTITSRQFQEFLPKYVWHMEEPVCEPPAIALYFVSRMAKDYVKVLLSGEGGDEAFGGYQNYRSLLWLERAKSVFGPLNGMISGGLSQLNRVLGSAKIGRYAPLLKVPFEKYYYSRTSSPFCVFKSQGASLYSSGFRQSLEANGAPDPLQQYFDASAKFDRVNRMLYMDTKTWLTDDLLLKADKITMANSIELRVPLLDHKLLEFAASLPGNYKVHGLTTKYIAKKVLSRKVPKEILQRRKVGFPVPYAAWMRTDLKDWLVDLVLSREAVGRGYFDKKGIEGLLSEHARSGKYSKELFSLAVLELWHREFLKKTGAHIPREVPVPVQA